MTIAYGDSASLSGNTASRPATDPTKIGRTYADTQAGILYRDNGTSWDAIARLSVEPLGGAPFAFPIGFDSQINLTAYTLAALSGGNAGAIAVPIHVPGNMLLSAVSIQNRDTSAARALEFLLFVDTSNDNNTLTAIAGSYTAWALVGAGNTVQTANLSEPISLKPGTYWAVLRNSHATATFALGITTGTQMSINQAQTKLLPTLNGLSTLDFVAATWTKTSTQPGIALRGRVFGQSSIF